MLLKIIYRTQQTGYIQDKEIKMFILVMTIYIHNSLFFIHSIDGFKTEQECIYLGAQQEVALRNDLKINTSKNYTFICVKGE